MATDLSELSQIVLFWSLLHCLASTSGRHTHSCIHIRHTLAPTCDFAESYASWRASGRTSCDCVATRSLFIGKPSWITVVQVKELCLGAHTHGEHQRVFSCCLTVRLFIPFTLARSAGAAVNDKKRKRAAGSDTVVISTATMEASRGW